LIRQSPSTCVFLIFCLIVTLSPRPMNAEPTEQGEPSSADGRQQQLRSLFDEDWDYELRAEPEFATALGDKRYNDRLSDRSQGSISRI